MSLGFEDGPKADGMAQTYAVIDAVLIDLDGNDNETLSYRTHNGRDLGDYQGKRVAPMAREWFGSGFMRIARVQIDLDLHGGRVFANESFKFPDLYGEHTPPHYLYATTVGVVINVQIVDPIHAPAAVRAAATAVGAFLLKNKIVPCSMEYEVVVHSGQNAPLAEPDTTQVELGNLHVESQSMVYNTLANFGKALLREAANGRTVVFGLKAVARGVQEAVDRLRAFTRK